MSYEIKAVIADFFEFFKNPQENFTESLSAKQKWKILFSILLLDFILVFFASGILSFIDSFLFELNSDPIEDIFSNKGVFSIILMAVVIVPLIEELIFRFPLKYERNLVFHFFDFLTKNRAKTLWFKYFKIIFYLFSIAFALMHLTNYSNTNALFYVLAPLIVLPQLIAGITLGYVRLKLGFFWGVLQHGLYNLILFSVALLFFNSNELTKINNADYLLEINIIEFGLNKPIKLETYKSENQTDSIIGNNTTVKELAEILNSTDSILLKNSKRINIRFINKTNSKNPETIVLDELKKEFK
jgi:membrane protease YdiL (CAAX protease family)